MTFLSPVRSSLDRYVEIIVMMSSTGSFPPPEAVGDRVGRGSREHSGETDNLHLSREESFNLPHSGAVVPPLGNSDTLITPSSLASAPEVNASYSRRLFIGSKRSLVVHLLPRSTSTLSPHDQLSAAARLSIPAICNFLYFGAAKVGVVYFGKQRCRSGEKEGIVDAEDLKKNLLRIITSEVWPPLRADVPDDHPADTPMNAVSLLQLGSMHALVYLKRCKNGTGYVKLLLRTTGRIHFDVVDREEKSRWESRMLHVRMLDSLETAKAVFSYEDYVHAFRAACVQALKQPIFFPIRSELGITSPSTTITDPGMYRMESGGSMEYTSTVSPTESPLERINEDTWGSIGVQWYTQEERSYRYFEVVTAPESVTLDYKSYYGDTIGEIEEKGVKFMCGFLNAYGQGKLVVGVHELVVPVSTSSPPSLNCSPSPQHARDSKEDKPRPFQVVVGANVTKEGIAEMARILGSQLLDCVPPIPPSVIRIELVPVVLPRTHETPATLLVFPQRGGDDIMRKELRQKTNHAIRVLSRHGKALCQLSPARVPEELRDMNAVCFCVVDAPAVQLGDGLTVGEDPDEEEEDDTGEPRWRKDLKQALGGLRWKTKSSVVELPSVELPMLHILELSVDRSRASDSFDMKNFTRKGGKFFNGWPTIPLWNVGTNSVGRMERNYHIFSQCQFGDSHVGGGRRRSLEFGFRGRHVDLGELAVYMTHWYDNIAITGLVLEYLDTGLKKLRGLRLLSRAFNDTFENMVGKDLVNLIELKPGSTSLATFDHDSIRVTQQALMTARLATLPLLLAWLIEQIGSLPSPYPYVAVPLSLTHLRLRPEWVPVYWVEGFAGPGTYGGYGLGTPITRSLPTACSPSSSGVQSPAMPTRPWSRIGDLKPSVVYDARDGLIKLPIFDLASGNLLRVENVVGIGFDNFTPEEVAHWKGGKALARFVFLTEEVASFHVPWGLKNLLLWIYTMAHDPHVQYVGVCQRSLAFACSPATEVCAAHYTQYHNSPISARTPSYADPTGVSPYSLTSARHALRSFDCCLHQAEQAWVQWEWAEEDAKKLRYDC